MDDVIIVIIVTIVSLIILFLIFREIICWYWKINERIKLQKKQNALLANILRVLQGDAPIEIENEIENEKSVETKEPDKPEEENVLNGVKLTEDEHIRVKAFVRHGFKPDERLVMNKKTREITRFDEKEWSKEDQEAWTILMDEGGRVIT